MKRFDVTRYALAACVALTACSNGNVLSSLPQSGPHGSQTFRFSGEPQTFTIPPRVNQLRITAYGARGDGVTTGSQGHPGGLGAAVEATIPVNPSESLMIFAGGKAKGVAGGFNGGGNAKGRAPDHGYGGGGSSDVRTGKGALADRIIVAGGGGGSGGFGSYCKSSGTCFFCPGGAGGEGGTSMGASGDAGGCNFLSPAGGGAGGSQKTGGGGGDGGPNSGPSLGGPGCAGVFGGRGTLRDGGTGANKCAGGGGGGGGGYYGGGGGGSGGCCYDRPVLARAAVEAAARLSSSRPQPTCSKRKEADRPATATSR